MVEGRQCKADKRISSGKSKLYRCTGAVIEPGVKRASGCSVSARACMHADDEWHVTATGLDHGNCTGQFGDNKNTSGMTQLPVWTTAAALVQTGSCDMPLVICVHTRSRRHRAPRCPLTPGSMTAPVHRYSLDLPLDILLSAMHWRSSTVMFLSKATLNASDVGNVSPLAMRFT